ncbi:MAG: flagellar hook basal-body protein [Planctomycetota bacterium]
MPYGLYLSASGAQAQSHRLQVLSNNLANVDTPGFKPQETVLQARFAELIEEGQVSPGLTGIDDLGGGVTVQPSQTNYQAGPIQQTGRETDFAIHDTESFFVIGRGEDQLLTRAGDFLFDNQGRLITQSGEPVMSTEGTPIQIEPGIPIQVGPEGTIRQAGSEWQLMLAKPKNPGDLTHLGGNLFKPLADIDLVGPTERNVVAGSLERSAVSPTAAMMELIETTRVYEANVQMIKNQDNVLGTLVGRLLQ